MKTMKKLLILLMLSFTIHTLDAQIAQLPKYRVEFKDKHNTTYSINNPSSYLSPRAIQRRTNQGISIDSTDLPVNQHYIDSVIALGGTLLTKSKWFNSITIAIDDTTKIPDIQALPFVSDIERTYPPGGIKSGGNKRPRLINTQEMHDEFQPYRHILPAAKQTQDMFSIKTINYGMGFNQANMIGIDYLHALGYTGDGIVIAVLDAGFLNVNTLPVFDSLRNSGRILGTYDFVNPGGDVYAQSSHGTMVLSTMAGNMPNDLVGTAPHASYWLLRTEDASTEFRIEEDNWISGAELADSAGADVLNTSLGYTEFYDPAMDYTYADMDGNTARITRGANMASSKGMFCVNSAGNSGNSPWKYIGAPADGFDILAVGAVNSNGTLASFSSHGPSYDGRVKPNVTAQGQGCYCCLSDRKYRPGKRNQLQRTNRGRSSCLSVAG
jgi:serine protease AprX